MPDPGIIGLGWCAKRPRVELIYDRDFPNIIEARTTLLHAFASAGVGASWTEWDRNAAVSPAYARKFGSPTILVEGRDVAGGDGTDGRDSCRIYPDEQQRFRKASSVGAIRIALAKSNRNAGPRNILLALPGLGSLFAPIGACPVCWPIYTSVLASAGLGFLTRTAYLLPISAALVALALMPVAYRAQRRGRYGPLAVGVGGAVAALIGKFVDAVPPLIYLGLVLLLSASIWDWRSASAGKSSCPKCASETPAVSLSKNPSKEV
jgi:mercuric ion transport protein